MELYRIPSSVINRHRRSFLEGALYTSIIEMNRNWSSDYIYGVPNDDNIDPGPILTACNARLIHSTSKENFIYPLAGHLSWRRYTIFYVWTKLICGISFEDAEQIWPKLSTACRHYKTYFWDPEKSFKQNINNDQFKLLIKPY